MTWTRAQSALLAITIATPVYQVLLRLPPVWAFYVLLPCRAAGFAGLVLASMAYVQAKKALGSRLRIEPEPAEGASLVNFGVYGRIRHPMYVALMLGAISWSLVWSSTWGLATAVASCAFLAIKIRREEELLAKTFPEYVSYSRSVPALIPRLFRLRDKA